MKYRFENFGGIIAGEEPPFLAFVDRDYMRNLGLGESHLWQTEDRSIGQLSAPTEVHFAITNRCSGSCPHCYMDAGAVDEGELDIEQFKAALDILADMNVFHIALGGGDALLRPDLFEIASYAREKGLVPNLTISGAGLTKAIAQKMKIFGQVNVSIDGVGENGSLFRSNGMFASADKALDLLIEAKVPAGINCVVGRKNFNGIGKLFGYASKKNVNEIEFLRFKPSGRGAQFFLQQRTTYEQNISLITVLDEFSRQFNITAKIDCSFIPMLCRHNPPIEILKASGTYGCEAGNVLLGIRSNGSVSGCSFLKGSGISIFGLQQAVKDKKEYFERLKNWTQNAAEPCKSCTYLNVCRGGCHAVSEYVTGNFDEPDPDCPFVVEYKKEGR